jgi:hypothetical protein
MSTIQISRTSGKIILANKDREVPITVLTSRTEATGAKRLKSLTLRSSKRYLS